jgi:drug/metabolite transporter (DMT)-like permease
MLFGGSIVVIILALLTQVLPYYFGIHFVPESFISNRAIDMSLLKTWGIPIALFGTIIPPLMFNKGFPITGVGLGSILSAFELPVSITISYFMLGEIINSTQWFGVFLILLAIILLNVRMKMFKF